MHAGLSFDFQNYAATRRILIDNGLKKYLDKNDPQVLWDAMRYSVLSGGKRIRALLCLAAAEAVCHGKRDESGSQSSFELALPCACAIEMIHAMSLIHDDLPCMDNDDLRRGQPTNHKVYGEAMALLAGDALILLANEVLLQETAAVVSKQRLIEVASGLSTAAGATGMVGGQVADMAFTGQASVLSSAENTASFLRKIHERKTGALFQFSVWSGACLLGADETTLDAFNRYGEILGLSFQVADDLLDVTGDRESLGKTPGKDKAADKLTWISVYGIEKARQQLSAWEREGKAILDKLPIAEDALKPLYALLEMAIHRKN